MENVCFGSHFFGVFGGRGPAGLAVNVPRVYRAEAVKRLSEGSEQGRARAAAHGAQQKVQK